MILNRDNKLWAPWRMEHIKRDLSNDKNKCVFCVDMNNSDDRKNLTLSRKKISNKFPIIGTEKDVTEIIVKSNILILLKSKKPGKRVK